MGLGTENALSEITLVLFTTLAPTGIVGCLAMMSQLLRKELPDFVRSALSTYLWIPVLVALIGLVASATHLGNPANALYVFSGVGRSPLSNEVCAGVVFFGLAGTYWFHSFSQKRQPVLERAWIALAMVSGAVFLACIAFAYQVETIPTWAHPLVPVALVLNGLVGGPLLALVGLAAAEVKEQGSVMGHTRRVVKACIVVSSVAIVADAVTYVAYGLSALPLANSSVSAVALAPHYYVALAVFIVACGTAVGLQAYVLRKEQQISIASASASALLACVGVFAMRFTFYMLHMTVGVSF